MQPPAELNIEPPCGCPSEKRIVLVGATVRAAAQSAGRAGFCVTGVDLFGDTDTLQACHRHFVVNGQHDPEQIAHACEAIRVIQVGGLNSHRLLIRRLADLSPMLGPSRLVQDQLRDVDGLREFAENAGMHFPATLDGSFSSSARPLDAEGRWLCKQRDGCGGLGVRWHLKNRGVSKDELIQKWIPGRSFGATLLSDGSNTRLLGVCRSLFTGHRNRPFVYAGSLGPIQISPSTSRALMRLGEQVVAATELRGLFNVDYVLDRSENAWLLEINPRWSGSSELIERWLVGQRRINANESLFALSVDALQNRDAAKSLIADTGEMIADTGEMSRLPPRPGTSAVPSSMYLKRVVFSPVEMRFDRSKFSKLTGPNESLHDVPVDGTVIGHREPVLTLVTKIPHNAIDPIDNHRVTLRSIRAAIGRCAEADYSSPRSSAYE